MNFFLLQQITTADINFYGHNSDLSATGYETDAQLPLTAAPW